MTDPRDAFRPLDLLSVAPRAPAEGEAQASTPLAAPFLLGLCVPEHVRDDVGRMLITVDPSYAVGDDGSRCWEWHADGLAVYLSVTTDGESEGYFRIASVQPEFVDGEVVEHAKEIEG